MELMQYFAFIISNQQVGTSNVSSNKIERGKYIKLSLAKYVDLA